MHNLPWDDLRYILAVAQNGSVNAAARALGVNHATVLRRIEKFETAQNTILFERHRSGYRTTPEAETIIAAIRRIETDVEQLGRRLSGQAFTLDGTVRLTTTDTISRCFMGPALAHMRRDHPGLRIDVVVSNEHLDLANLASDVTIRPAPSLPAELAGKLVGHLSFGLYAARNRHPDDPGAAWLQPAGRLGRSPVGNWMAGRSNLRIVASADSFVTLSEMAAAGLGCAVLPTCIGDTIPTLLRYPVDTAIEDVPVWLGMHADRVEHAQSRAIFSAMQACLQTAFATAGQGPLPTSHASEPAAPPSPKDQL